MSNLTKEQIEQHGARGFLVIGTHTKLHGNVSFEPPVTAHDCVIIGPTHIGRHSVIGDFSHIAPHSTLGRYCSIANSCTIGAPPPTLDWLSTHGFQQLGLIGTKTTTRPRQLPETKLGHDVSIGANAVVLAGLTIGDGAVVEAGSVVTRDVPPYAVVGGNPAKEMKPRFGRKIVAELMSLKWWDLPPAELAELPFDDIAQCLARLREIRKRIGPS